MNILLHPKTESLLQYLRTATPHAVLLHGPKGSGKSYAAEYVAGQVLDTPLQNHPYYRMFSPETGKAVGIDTIRELQKFLQLKTTGQGAIRRLAVIEAADSMGDEAQNALLKSLEEPPADTMIILLAADQAQLRPTILSRLTSVSLLAIGRQQAEEHFATIDPAMFASSYNLSGGLAGTLSLLLSSGGRLESHSAMEQAKDLLTLTPFERLAHVEQLSKDNEQLQETLSALDRLLAVLHAQAAHKQQASQLKRLQQSRYALQAAKRALSLHGPAKLVLTDLCLNL